MSPLKPSRVLVFVLAFLVTLLCGSLAYCQITWSGPRLTPQEAADVLRQAPGLANLTGVGTYRPPDGPTFGTTGSRGPTAGPWDWPAPIASRRLDGTPVDRPPTVYGLPYWWVVDQNRPLLERRRDHESSRITPVHHR